MKQGEAFSKQPAEVRESMTKSNDFLRSIKHYNPFQETPCIVILFHYQRSTLVHALCAILHKVLSPGCMESQLQHLYAYNVSRTEKGTCTCVLSRLEATGKQNRELKTVQQPHNQPHPIQNYSLDKENQSHDSVPQLGAYFPDLHENTEEQHPVSASLVQENTELPFLKQEPLLQ